MWPLNSYFYKIESIKAMIQYSLKFHVPTFFISFFRAEANFVFRVMPIFLYQKKESKK